MLHGNLKKRTFISVDRIDTHSIFGIVRYAAPIADGHRRTDRRVER